MEQDSITPLELQKLDLDIQNSDRLDRLLKNRDFKALILDMYLDDGSTYLTRNLTRVKDRDAITEQYLSRSYLYRFLDDIAQAGNEAREYYKELGE